MLTSSGTAQLKPHDILKKPPAQKCLSVARNCGLKPLPVLAPGVKVMRSAAAAPLPLALKQAPESMGSLQFPSAGHGAACTAALERASRDTRSGCACSSLPQQALNTA